MSARHFMIWWMARVADGVGLVLYLNAPIYALNLHHLR